MITIKPACIRDASFVMANMRPLDKLEVMCQVPETAKIHELAHWLVMGSDAFVAYVDDRPSMVFGTSPINAVCLSVWAVGTKRTRRCVPAVTRFMIGQHIPARIAEGFRSMEARSLVEHHEAHRWMTATGAVVHGPDFAYGRDDEMFRLFRWTAAVQPIAAERFL